MEEADRRRLLQIARDAITAHINGAAAAEVIAFPSLERPGGAFVSIHHGGELRGCIGLLEAQSLLRVVRDCAVSACSADPRFTPVSADELVALEIEVSVLGTFEPVASPDDIEVGRHGLLIEQNGQRGLLLPQVATEWRWDREMFLAQACHKAGLRRDAWKQGAKVWRFEAEVFSDAGGAGGAGEAGG
jgi:AmmeMemoRadiSam system protein A